MKGLTDDRKLDLQSQARRAVRRVDPTERCRSVLLAVGGPHPPLLLTFGGVLAMFLTSAYFLTLTDRAVYVHRGSRPEDQPEILVQVVPFEQAAGLIAKVKRGRTWNVLFLRLPGRSRSIRLNLSYQSRDDLERFVANLEKSIERAGVQPVSESARQPAASNTAAADDRGPDDPRAEDRRAVGKWIS
ncbi:hypothetical protein C7C46_14205 [Streptomyces tateyamensis]|uniref:Uncharacterized protein n=1 Tax=Streptomyces tateyamensis TaxID=565073 RepID=A0A2V4N5J5_9ACTN|nr:hypothetical protein [Streptomyces tateyamensis]PYC79511.1 hypothetical protein C7C46_14205 [Streptomyces tateyamensis]